MSSTHSLPTDHRYLRMEDLSRLRHRLFASRNVVEGHYAGRHASPHRGHSVEFNDYREYTPGEEVGAIDWKVFGRSDRLYIKLFEHQTDMAVSLLIDASASMCYPAIASDTAPAPATTHRKYDHACMMAAAIAFLAVRQQDRVALGFARDGLADFHRPHGTFAHLSELLAHMEGVTPGGNAALAATLRALAGRISRKGLLIVFSDLWDNQDDILRALTIFTHRGNEVIVFHILHEDEFRLPNLDDAVFLDSETGSRVRLNAREAQADYQQRLARHLAGWATALRTRGIDHNIVNTSLPYHESLERYLFARGGRV